VSVTPTGILSLPLNYLRLTVAGSSTFRTWVGAASAAAALGYVHPVEVIGAAGEVTLAAGAFSTVSLVRGGAGYDAAPAVTVEGDGTGATVTAAVSAGAVTGFTVTAGGSGYGEKALVYVAPPDLPYAVVDFAEDWSHSAIASGARTHFDDSGDLLVWFFGAVNAAHDPADAWNTFGNAVGGIIGDMDLLAGTAGYLDISQITWAEHPARPTAREVAGGITDHYRCALRVAYGLEGVA